MNWRGLLDETEIAALLPVEYSHFARPIRDGLALFLEELPAARQSEALARQVALPATASVAERLGAIARCSSVLQKLGQVLARDQQLSPDLRRHLRELESSAPSITLKKIQEMLTAEFRPLDALGVDLSQPPIAEASVAVVVPFRKRRSSGSVQHGVFKILKPGVEERLEYDLDLMTRIGARLDERCDELKIPHLDYEDVFQQVRDKLCEEISLDAEQWKLAAAKELYADDPRVLIPSLFDCCTPRVTAMERVWGCKVTDHVLPGESDRRRLAELIIEAIVARPIFAEAASSMFHCDPHAGNLFLTTDGRLAILDWSLVGWLDKDSRNKIVRILLCAATHDERRLSAILIEMADSNGVQTAPLRAIVKRYLAKLRRGAIPGIRWLVGLMDDAVRDARLRLPADLLMFRKTLYTLTGVVSDVGASEFVFDKVLSVTFLRHFAAEWPARWFSLPHSRDFTTHLSNRDVTEAILSLPTSVARILAAEGLDLLNSWRCNQTLSC